MYPIALNLTRIPVLLIGQGEIVQRRLEQLKEAGAEHVVLRDKLLKGDIEKASVVLVAGLPREEAEVIVTACRLAAKLVNVEDINDLCDFYFTANVKRGDLVIAVSTSGASPTLARKVRDAIGARFGNEWENRTRELAALRMKWRAQGKNMKEVVAASEDYISKKGWLK